jgi:transcription elongation factor GreA
MDQNSLHLYQTTVSETKPLFIFLTGLNELFQSDGPGKQQKMVTMSKKLSYYTKEGLDKLKNELTELKGRGRSNIAKQIAEARDKGDLSENAEYDAAKDAQGHLEAKIAQLENLLASARLLDESSVDTSKVSILSKVTIKNKKNGASFTYTLVTEEEADLKKGKISTTSPIGKGLLGKKQGESAQIKTPAGEIEFEIVNITA